MASGHCRTMTKVANARIVPAHRVLVVLATLVVMLALTVGINIDPEWGASYHDGAGNAAH